MIQTTASSPSPSLLPPLAFGEASAVVQADPRSFADHLARVVQAMQDCQPVGGTRFAHKSSFITINGLKLVAAGSTPVHVEVGDTREITLLVPFAGESRTMAGLVEHRWRAGESAMFLPGGARRGEAAPQSVLMLDIDAERLARVGRAMLGLAPGEPVDFDLEQARAVPLRRGGVSHDLVFRSLCALVDGYGADREALAFAGVDDQFYRHMAMMLMRSVVTPERLSWLPRRARSVDALCDFIDSRLHEPLSLTDLEQASGLSRRSLQYAFLERFQCSPMQWVRMRRLDGARAMLLDPAEGRSVTAVALRWGFGHLGAFSAYYRQRFSEAPSQTLREASTRRR